MTERRTPLLEAHAELGAKLTEFAGWDMPLQFSGIVSEHNSVRSSVGVFDVSHLGKLRLEGASAGKALDRAVTADIGALEVGRATYALVLYDDGGCVDDLFVYRLGSHEWLVVPNAANVQEVARALVEAGASPVDEWSRWAILAVQGPGSFETFDRAFPAGGAGELELHSWKGLEVCGDTGFVARTGYTGERGFELYAPSAVAPQAYGALLDAGCAPVGLGARDTLRLEMGYALYGHEISPDINPLEAGLGWAIDWESSFRGREALDGVRESGPARRLFGFLCKERGVPRAGYAVVDEDRTLGEVTSGNYSPTLGTGIALALGPAESTPEAGRAAAVEARGRRIDGVIVKPPFVGKGERTKK
ncbi:MAG: glycine cleavage system aminomethyltransferase GcvT [Actinobacteria bacterium]|nr:glycine cleavage system aminomethyltransferase GcvT [Actinomycetota bacterium]